MPVPTLREAVVYFIRLVVLVRPYWAGMTRSIALGFVGGCIGLITPYLSKIYFDEVYPARDERLLHALVLAVAAFAVASAVMGAIRGYYSQVISARLSGAM